MRRYEVGEVNGGAEGMDCEVSRDCTSRTWTIWLTEHEVNRLNDEHPELVSDGMAYGHEATMTLFKKRMGVVGCDKHGLWLIDRGDDGLSLPRCDGCGQLSTTLKLCKCALSQFIGWYKEYLCWRCRERFEALEVEDISGYEGKLPGEQVDRGV